MTLQSLVWTPARLGEAIEVLALKSGLLAAPPGDLRNLSNPDGLTDDALGRWIDSAAAPLGLEAEAVDVPYPEVARLIRGAGPALFRQSGGEGFLAVLRCGGRMVTVVGPDARLHRLPLDSVRAALCVELESPLAAVGDDLLVEAAIPAGRRDHVRATLLAERLRGARMGGCWILRLSPSAGLWAHARQSRLFYPLVALAAAFLAGQLITIGAWAIIGRGALVGSFTRPGLSVWALLVFTAIPFQLLTTWCQSRLAVGAGSLFRERLLFGILRLSPDEIRHQGAGQFLGRVMEAEAFELLGLGGGFTAAVSLLQLILAAWVLSAGAGGWVHALLLAIWVGAALALNARYFRQAREWSDAYRGMTNDLVERMVGHRTRLAQEDRARWHDDEDAALNRYLKLSERLDAVGAQLSAIIPRGWFILGLAGILPAFVVGAAAPAALAISVGGVLLAAQALAGLVGGAVSIAAARLAWDQVGPLFEAAERARSDDFSRPLTAEAVTTNGSQPLVIARELTFRYHERSQPALRGCSLRIERGERILLEGPSGGGKSTLAALLAGLRVPESGLILMDGADRHTLGEGEWRRRAAAAPQFHENHVLTETFAFNLLMGRRWPPTEADLAEAETVCREMGLGDLLGRMPAGFQQMIGEGGWQLSHGERSRLFVARALLQGADLVLLDESFAALDPENLRRALACSLNRAPTLLVIAHP